MQKPWKKEFARDLIALGSIPFYFIVTIRAVIGEFTPFVSHLVMALLVYFVLSKVMASSDPYVARSLILLIFVSFFYRVMLFTVFAVVLWLCILWAQKYLRVKNNALLKGVLLGLISSGVSYILTTLLRMKGII